MVERLPSQQLNTTDPPDSLAAQRKQTNLVNSLEGQTKDAAPIDWPHR